MATDRRALGAAGEALVARWYEAHGFDVVARNWRCPTGELDVIVRKGNLVVFCEVKTRTSLAFGAPAEAVTIAKQRRLRILGAKWLEATKTRAASIRFDVAAVIGEDIDVLEGVL
jgi:putative endonuclease